MAIENKEMNIVFYEIETAGRDNLQDVINEAENIQEMFNNWAVTYHYHFLGIMGVVPTRMGRKRITFNDDDEIVLCEEPRNPNTNRYIIRVVIYVNDTENFAEKLKEHLLCIGKYSFSRGDYLGNRYKAKVFGILCKCEKMFTLDCYDEDLNPYAYKFVKDVEQIHCIIGKEHRVFLREYYGEHTDDKAEEKEAE